MTLDPFMIIMAGALLSLNLGALLLFRQIVKF